MHNEILHAIGIFFIQNESVKFTRIYDPNNKMYAFYTLIDNDPHRRAYLLPQVDPNQSGHRSKTIRVVEPDDQSDAKKYAVFTYQKIKDYI